MRREQEAPDVLGRDVEAAKRGIAESDEDDIRDLVDDNGDFSNDNDDGGGGQNDQEDGAELRHNTSLTEILYTFNDRYVDQTLSALSKFTYLFSRSIVLERHYYHRLTIGLIIV